MEHAKDRFLRKGWRSMARERDEIATMEREMLILVAWFLLPIRAAAIYEAAV